MWMTLYNKALQTTACRPNMAPCSTKNKKCVSLRPQAEVKTSIAIIIDSKYYIHICINSMNDNIIDITFTISNKA